MLFVNQNGVLLNDPFISTGFNLIYINSTNITHITNDDWERIKDRQTENSTLKVNNDQSIVVRSFINSYESNVIFFFKFE